MNISFTWSNMVLFWGHDLVIRKKWAQLWSHSIMTRPTHCGHSFSCIISSLLFKYYWKNMLDVTSQVFFSKYWLSNNLLSTVYLLGMYLLSVPTKSLYSYWALYAYCTFKRSWWHSHQSQLIIFEFN